MGIGGGGGRWGATMLSATCWGFPWWNCFQIFIKHNLPLSVSKEVWISLEETLIEAIINVKKILAVVNATYAVAKRKPEKVRLAGIRTLASAIPVQRSNQLS